ncbi:GNAT family N-acetyltransferase [soil metagenome]
MIRSATANDIAVICQLIRDLAEYERLSHEVVVEESRLREHLFGARPYAHVLLIEEAGEVAGFAFYFYTYSTFLGRPGIYLEDLFVRPAFRGKGHGKALLLRLARIATEEGCGRVEWAVLNWNEPAIKFYQSLEAKPMTEWTVYRLAGPSLEARASEAAK